MINTWALVAPTIAATTGLAWRMGTSRRRRRARAAAQLAAGRVALKREVARLAAAEGDELRRSTVRLHATIPPDSPAWQPLPCRAVVYDWKDEP